MPPDMLLAVVKFREARAIKSAIDIAGMRFGMLVAIEPLEYRNENGGVLWRCKCDCGGEGIFPAGQLRNGSNKSCGCLSRNRGRPQRLTVPPEFEDCIANRPDKYFNGCEALIELMCAKEGKCKFYKSKNDLIE